MGIALAGNLVVALFFGEAVLAFVLPALLNFALFAGLARASKRKPPSQFKKKEAILTVSIAWFFMTLVSALPYVIGGAIPSFVDAWFESVSGYTTTGSTILAEIESLPKSILFWRDLTHWIGGIGIIVLVIVIMPGAQMNNYAVFSLESSIREKIHPRIRSVGYRLLIIYLGLTVLQINLLLLGGMNLFESVCHSFATVATGGFSPKNTSIIDYSPYIQYVIAVFMLLGATNFIVHYYLIHSHLDKVWNNDELWFFLKVVMVSTLFITLFLVLKTDRDLEKSFRDAFFQVSSIISTTGFASDDYLLWPPAASVVIFILLFTGGSTGSTTGGIKMARHLLAGRSIRYYFRSQLHPNAIYSLKLNNKKLSPSESNSVTAFIYSYLTIFVIGSIALVLIGSDLLTATSSVATTLGAIGPGFGTVGPVANFAHLPDASKVILSLCMLLGRLELYSILLIVTPGFWKK